MSIISEAVLPCDHLELLEARGLRLTKRWNSAGKIDSYDDAKFFSRKVVRVGNLLELSSLLRELEGRPSTALIRGRYRTDAARDTDVGLTDDELATAKRASFVRKALHYFGDQALHSMLIDIDKFDPLTCDPVQDPGEAVAEYIATCLPYPFHGAAHHWQMSGSAGHPDKPGLRAHVWFWLQEPLSSAQLKAWATATGAAVDKAIYHPVQWHFCANPVFADGVADPVPVRSGFVQGGEVHLEIDEQMRQALPASATALTKLRTMDDCRDPNVEKLVAKGLVVEEFAHGLGVTCINAPHQSGESGTSQSMYFPIGVGGRTEPGYKCQHAQCRDTVTAAVYLRATGVDNPGDDFVPVALPGDQVAVAKPNFLRDRMGAPLPTMNNVLLAVRRPDVAGLSVRRDSFLDKVLVSFPNGETRPLDDDDITELRGQLERNDFRTMSKELAKDALHLVARENRYDSATAWGESLKWDGVGRVDSSMTRYYGCEDTPYSRSIGAYLWTGLAARLMDPGHQCDMVPVLVGLQGTGKTSAVAALSPRREFFGEIDLGKIDHDDTRRLIRGKLVIELGELRGLQSRDAESVKQFIVRRFEEWVGKFKEYAAAYPRRCLFVGTSNTDEFLADATGERRWLPVRTGAIDIDAIERDRDQLWAEGIVRFIAGGVEWQDAERLAQAEHGKFKVTDSWEERIGDWLANSDIDGGKPRQAGDFRMSAVLASALTLQPAQCTRPNEMRAARVLRGMGYRSTSAKAGAHSVRVWRAAE